MRPRRRPVRRTTKNRQTSPQARFPPSMAAKRRIRSPPTTSFLRSRASGIRSSSSCAASRKSFGTISVPTASACCCGVGAQSFEQLPICSLNQAGRLRAICGLRWLGFAQPPLATAFPARRRIDPSSGGYLSHRRTSRSTAGVAFHLGRRGEGLRLSHASLEAADTGHLLAKGTGCPIVREALEGLPALASYLSARSRRRFLVNGSAFSARSRASTARRLKNSMSINYPHATKAHFQDTQRVPSSDDSLFPINMREGSSAPYRGMRPERECMSRPHSSKPRRTVGGPSRTSSV
jgi:hypothetical protein